MEIQELREWDELFSTAGWKRLLDQAGTELENLQINALNGTKEYSDVTFLRGQAVQLYNLIHLEDTILNVAKAEAEEVSDADVYVPVS